MINIGLSLVVWAAVSGLFVFGINMNWVLSLILGFAVGLLVLILLGRRVQNQLEAIMQQMQKAAQNGKIEQAIAAAKQGYRFKWWQLFVESQINAQIGMLYYLKKNHQKALPYLKKGFVKHYIAQGMLAAIYYKKKEYDAMKQTMQDTIKGNKKESITYALYAYFLSKIKEKDEAIAILQKGLKKLPDDKNLMQNLILLQNNKRMKMRMYGDIWTQFMLEKLPRIQQAQPQHARFSKRAMFK
ncbi:MAG: hypothetical protein CSA81_10045 [Acidobacteria bacterium]|nr:MAG: hypothetical protein CSA81_10045 [Acidobacteriota bacterium]PIE90789.1 MAG: hypothetical protein CR997_03960 [Acidobacteriota bacterium]